MKALAPAFQEQFMSGRQHLAPVAVAIQGRAPGFLSLLAAAGGRLIIAGGTSGERATADVYGFDPASGLVRMPAVLPGALTHAGAAAVGGYVYVIADRGTAQGTQTSQVLAIDPRNGRAVPAGRLPTALSDAGVTATGDAVIVSGGREARGVVSDRVYLLRPRRRAP
jgi:hypothetical protein